MIPPPCNWHPEELLFEFSTNFKFHQLSLTLQACATSHTENRKSAPNILTCSRINLTTMQNPYKMMFFAQGLDRSPWNSGPARGPSTSYSYLYSWIVFHYCFSGWTEAARKAQNLRKGHCSGLHSSMQCRNQISLLLLQLLRLRLFTFMGQEYEMCLTGFFQFPSCHCNHHDGSTTARNMYSLMVNVVRHLRYCLAHVISRIIIIKIVLPLCLPT